MKFFNTVHDVFFFCLIVFVGYPILPMIMQESIPLIDFQTADKTTICVNVPYSMQKSLKDIVNLMGGKYNLKFTNSLDANFIVEEGGCNNVGEFIAYTPFVAVFNLEENLQYELIREEIFIKSRIDSQRYDLDFKRIMKQVLDGNCSFNIYIPEKTSVYWEEFYIFLVITLNEGIFPKNIENLEEIQEDIQSFLNSDKVQYTNYAINSIKKDSIVFITYLDLAELYENIETQDILIMYPIDVVCHNYYASFDEKGKRIFDLFTDSYRSIIIKTDNMGHYILNKNYFNTVYTRGVPQFTKKDIGKRDSYKVFEV